jgi:hypothetical protein
MDPTFKGLHQAHAVALDAYQREDLGAYLPAEEVRRARGHDPRRAEPP